MSDRLSFFGLGGLWLQPMELAEEVATWAVNIYRRLCDRFARHHSRLPQMAANQWSLRPIGTGGSSY